MNTFRLNTMMLWWLSLLLALPIMAWSADGNKPVPNNATATANTFVATLSGSQEVPPVVSAASGTGEVVVDPSTRNMKATVKTTGIAGNAAHIHEAPIGKPGPVVFPLTETSPGSGVWITQVTLTEAQLNTLRAGNYYFNVHTTAFPNGEIRGQIQQQKSQSSGGSTTGTGSTGTTGTTGSGS